MERAPRYTVDKLFTDFNGRRAGLIKALTSDAESFYQQCDPDGNENLCLYGHPDETWEVTLPEAEVPASLPEPALGINFARDGMQQRDWLILVAVHCDSWLLAVAFYFGIRSGFGSSKRKRLFEMINELPTICEVVMGNVKQENDQSSSKASESNQSEHHNKRVKTAVGRKLSTKTAEAKEEESGEDEQGGALCGTCNDNFGNDEFRICCNICETWFHGECVKIAPARAKHMKHYKCLGCRINNATRV